MQLNVERFKMSSVLKKNKKNTFQSYSLGKNNDTDPFMKGKGQCWD